MTIYGPPILSHFEALWRPPMAIPDLGNGPNTSPQMCPTLIQPWSALIHHFGASRPAYGHKRPIYGQFEPFWGPMAGFNSELIHKTRNACCSKIIKKTKENNKNCLGSQIETFEIRIGNWLELTHCDLVAKIVTNRSLHLAVSQPFVNTC